MQLSEDSDKKPQRANALQFLWSRLKEHPLSRLDRGLSRASLMTIRAVLLPTRRRVLSSASTCCGRCRLAFPLMAAIQFMCAHIGRVTGKGLAANIKSGIPADRAQGRRVTAAGCQHTQYRRRRRGHGGSRRTGQRLQSSPDDGGLCRWHAAAADIRSLSPLRLFPEVVDAFAAGLCRGAVHGPRAVGRGGAPHGVAEPDVEFQRRCRGRGRRLRHDDQPISLFLAGVRGSGRHACQGGRRAASAGSRRRARRNCGASTGTPGAACSIPI